MESGGTHSEGVLARAWRWLKNHIVVEVPAHSAVCEFDCRKQQCRFDEWATCERRLSHFAADVIPEKRGDDRP